MGIQICSNKGAGPFWDPIRGKIRKNLINLKNSSSHEPLAGNALIFGMEYPWGKEIHICSNEVPGVINGHTLRGQFYIGLYSKNLKTFSH